MNSTPEQRRAIIEQFAAKGDPFCKDLLAGPTQRAIDSESKTAKCSCGWPYIGANQPLKCEKCGYVGCNNCWAVKVGEDYEYKCPKCSQKEDIDRYFDGEIEAGDVK